MEPVREVASDISGQVQDSARAAAARTAEQVKQSGQTVRGEVRS